MFLMRYKSFNGASQKSVPVDPFAYVASPFPPTREVLKAVAPRAMAASDRWLRAPRARGSGPARWSSRTLVVLSGCLAVWFSLGSPGFPWLFSTVAPCGHISNG